MQREEIVSLVRSLPKDGRPFAVAIWDRAHVIQYASEQGIELTTQQADEGVRILARRNDAETKFNFAGLGLFLDELENRKQTSRFVATEKLIRMLRKESSTGAVGRLLDVTPSQAAKVIQSRAFTRATARKIWKKFGGIPKDELVRSPEL